MRAMVFTETSGPAALRAVKRDVPKPGPGEVLVAVGGTALNYRDLLIANGGYRSRQKQRDLVPLSDCAGRIAELGDGIEQWQVGDRVTACFFQDWPAGSASTRAMESDIGRTCDGALQEYRIFKAGGLVPTPTHLTDVEAASLTCAGLTAWSAIHRLGLVQSGDSVLTQGTGGVSLFALQFAKLAGARLAITSSSDEKLARAIDLGADHGINYNDHPAWGEAAKSWAGGDGVDNVIELGGTETMKQSLLAVRPGGTLSLIGVLSGATTGNILLPFIISRDVRLQGVTVGPAEDMARMCRAVDAAKLRPVIDTVFPFEDAAAAYQHLTAAGHFGKVCIAVADL